MSPRVVCDFNAEVTLSSVNPDEPRSMRVLVSEEQIVFGSESMKRTIGLDDVFDVVRDVSRGATPNTSELVSIAFRSGGTKAVASIGARADALVQFQGALYGGALGGTPCLLEHEQSGGVGELPTDRFRLAVTASKIRFAAADDSGATIAIPRDRVREFRSLSEPDSGQRPEVLLLSDDDDGLTKTILRFPSTRHRNLFGRYLKSELRLSESSTTDDGDDRESIELLLVDDDQQDLHAAEMFLNQRPEPFSIEIASGARPALEMLENGDPIDCVVSDFRMPGMDGIEFLRTVRERYSRLPFILYTGKGSEDVAKRALLDDVTDYVEKDVGTEQYDVLAERIGKAIRDLSGRRR